MDRADDVEHAPIGLAGFTLSVNGVGSTPITAGNGVAGRGLYAVAQDVLGPRSGATALPSYFVTATPASSIA